MVRSRVARGVAAAAAVVVLLVGLVAVQARQGTQVEAEKAPPRVSQVEITPATPPASRAAPPRTSPIVEFTGGTGSTPPASTAGGRPPSPLPPVEAQPRPLGIDELIAQLEAIKARKAELDRAEKETTALLKEKVRQLRQRLQKAGVADDGDPQPTPSYTVPHSVVPQPGGAVPASPPDTPPPGPGASRG